MLLAVRTTCTARAPRASPKRKKKSASIFCFLIGHSIGEIAAREAKRGSNLVDFSKEHSAVPALLLVVQVLGQRPVGELLEQDFVATLSNAVELGFGVLDRDTP